MPVKNVTFYTELVVTTVLSLLAASLWIEWTKDMVIEIFGTSRWALLGTALVVTLIAVFILKLLFTTELGPEKYRPEDQGQEDEN